ncbi:MAG: glycerol-3-phosphate 1-O-acyltransferase PlsY [Chloroflexi bacterium]|nr:glycerol-3-phosphate 1-O-acyltransferase PlsY [Chloroflexota bacterium]
MWWAFPSAIAIGYLLGSFPTGLIAGRLARGIDVREYGSGNTGFTNVLRTVGARWGIAVLVLDLAKGAAPVLIARVLSDEPYVQAVAGLAAAVGHDWPVFIGFRGGRGVAASYGAALAMNPIAAAAMLPFGIGLVAMTRIMSLMSIGLAPVLALVFVVLAIFDVHPWAYAVYASVGAVLIVVQHRENVQRLLAGTEPKLGAGGERRGQKSAAD